MNIRSATFISSYVDVKKCPKTHLHEFAFTGRSNVGKSSLINMLTGFNSVAKISSTPGKTQTMNYFLINEQWHLVDLPGYGYAKVSRNMRVDWNKMIKNYLIDRENLQCVFQLIDATIPPQKLDIEFTNWMGEHAIPFVLIFTKSDKKNKAGGNAAQLYEKELSETWETLPQTFITSSKTKTGRDEILNYISEILIKNPY
ncbi:MAG: YihA family ribosome biogenesis GTP-binding protein [Fimbriimonadaceae bacterium]|nr:YihA family ribosome biogenesis GTP-binding protein [Chitinophagales bacterium]